MDSEMFRFRDTYRVFHSSKCFFLDMVGLKRNTRIFFSYYYLNYITKFRFTEIETKFQLLLTQKR